MVKKYIFLFLASTTFLLSACSKDKEEYADETSSHFTDYFTAIISPYSNEGKTYIELGGLHDYSCWANGDAVNINGTVREISVTGTTDNYTATIGADGIEAVNGGFLAAYPGDAATVINSTATFLLPATTEYQTVGSGAGSGSQVVEAPMVAYTTARELRFKNMGALTLFHLNVEGVATVYLNRITISSDQPLNGSYSVTYNNEEWQYSTAGLDGTGRTLLCSTPVALNTTVQPFYLYLPPVSEATSITVDIMLTVDGVRRHFSRTKSGTIQLDTNSCYDFGTLTYNTSTSTLTDGNSYDEVVPTGSEEDPYLIGNAAEWYYWCNAQASNSDAHFLLEDGFSVTRAISEFKGILNGNGHTVELNDCSLIAYLNGGTIKNLNAEGSVAGNQYTNGYRNTCGSIAASAESAQIIHCINNAIIKIENNASSQMDIGGIVGNASKTVINNCKNKVAIGTESLGSVTFNAGGIVGNLSGIGSKVINCCNRGDINIKGGSGSNVGGAVGRAANNTEVLNSYAYCTVTSTGTYTGGFAGSSKSSIQNCYFYGTAPAFCYRNEKTIHRCYYSCENIILDSAEAGTSVTECHKLSNATTLQDGTNLYEQLNNNIREIPISGASDWSISNGVTILDWEL